MRFCIADTFTKALQKLTSQEQKAVKTTVFDLQLDPASPGMQFHRIDKSRDPNFWSIRVNLDLRLIVHKTEDSFLVCYVDHHDDAYAWAERRRIEAHPKTGATQIVEVRERVEEIAIQRAIVEESKPAAPKQQLLPLFAEYDTEELLTYGIPEDWIADVKAVTEDTLFDIVEHLPQEAAEALLDLAVGQKPEVTIAPKEQKADPLAHPDAQRRFRVMENVDELKRALEYPWDQWTIFLHPSQRSVVMQKFNGHARVSGSAGTGKTVVAIHRAANILKEDDDAKLLLTTFSLPLSNALEHKLELLLGKDTSVVPHYTVLPFKGVARELFTLAFGYEPRAATAEQVKAMLEDVAQELEITDFTDRFLMSEWSNVIDAWQIDSLDAYKDVPRLGRKNRMSASQRTLIWPIFEQTKERLAEQGLFTWPTIFGKVAEFFDAKEEKPFTHAVIDEAQDLGVPELKMLSAITPRGPNSLFFAGDLGQRIFQEPFSWKALGIDIRGRSRTLKVNYRTSHQIRQSADKLLPKLIRDVDGNEEDRTGTVSVFNGPDPEVQIQENEKSEIENVTAWVAARIQDGIKPEEIGIFVRTKHELPRARAVIQAGNHTALEISDRVEDATGRISIGTMHMAKGLEFKAVIVMACDDEILPLQERIETIADESELNEVYETERHLFYVACTRARDRLLVSGIRPASVFFEDMA